MNIIMLEAITHRLSSALMAFTAPMDFLNKRKECFFKDPLFSFRFITTWAFIAHVLFYIGVLSINTFVVAIFIMLGSIIVFWIYPGYYVNIYKLDVKDPSSPYYEMSQNKYRYILLLAILDISVHYMPLLLTRFPKNSRDWIQSSILLFIMLIVYISVYGLRLIWNQYYYLNDPASSVFLNCQIEK